MSDLRDEALKAMMDARLAAYKAWSKSVSEKSDWLAGEVSER